MATNSSKRLGTAPEEGVKGPVRCATQSNITLAGLQTIDSYAVQSGDRVLVRAQTDSTENGIYVAEAGDWNRAKDWNRANDVVNGVLVLDANTSTLYRASFSGTFTIDTTAVQFVSFTGNILSVNNVTLTGGQTEVDLLLGSNYKFAAGVSRFRVSGPLVDDGYLTLNSDYTVDSDSVITLLSSYDAGTVLTQESNDTGAFAGEESSIAIPDGTELEVIAHRGFIPSFPQNTMLAFSSAIRRGADSLECDVQVTSDGVCVVYHDDTLDTLTDGSGAVASNSLSSVQSAVIDEVAGTYLAGVRIPRFSELLRYCKGAGLRLYPEIKKYRTQADISLMIADVVAAGMEDQVFFASFSLSDVQYFRTLNTDISVGLLGSSNVAATYEPLIDTLALLGNTTILWNYAAILTAPALVDYAKVRGVDVISWTVLENNHAKQLMRYGVSRLITDRILEVR